MRKGIMGLFCGIVVLAILGGLPVMGKEAPGKFPAADAILDTVQELLEIPSPSGREEKMAAAICKKVEQAGYKWSMDGAGNVSVRVPAKDENAPLTIMAAHMDEIALVVSNINPDGTLKVQRSGGMTLAKVGEGPVTVMGDKGEITGVISTGTGHRRDRNRAVGWHDAWIMTGLPVNELKAKGIRPGSTIVPRPEGRGIYTFGDPKDPLVAAWTFDDRAGVATLIELLRTIKKEKIKPATPLMISFTVQEEVGCYGAVVLAQREKPEVFLAVDGSAMPPGLGMTLDGRPATWSRDPAIHYDQKLVAFLLKCAEKAATELQVVVLDAAGSDASWVFTVGAAPRVGICGHVRENSHGFEVARKSTFQNLHNTLVQYIKMGMDIKKR